MTQLHDSKPFQLGNDTVGRQEFDFPLENAQFWQLDVKNEENEVSQIYVFSFLDIAHTDPHSFGRHLVGMLRMGLPQLSKQLRDQNNRQKPPTNENQNFERINNY